MTVCRPFLTCIALADDTANRLNQQYAKCYEESQKRVVRFQQTLQRLAAVLRERHVEEELGIAIKDPREFTLDYVIELTEKIHEGRENGLKIRSCKNFAKRCFRKVQENRQVIDGILGLVPDDIYGSVISGGFSLIMAVSIGYSYYSIH